MRKKSPVKLHAKYNACKPDGSVYNKRKQTQRYEERISLTNRPGSNNIMASQLMIPRAPLDNGFENAARC